MYEQYSSRRKESGKSLAETTEKLRWHGYQLLWFIASSA
jgi:hypothetical protein